MAHVEVKKVVAPRGVSRDRADIAVPSEPLAPEAQHRLAVIQRLQRCQGKANYSIEQKKAATELGLSARSLRRLQRQYQEVGIAGIKRQSRSDEGQFRVSEYWQSFITKAYGEGNKGQRQTSRAQVAKQVASHASAIGETDYPSRRSVYRVLSGEIERLEHKQKSRSIGWQGETLKLRTKEGIELDIEYSNQVWQVDHTQGYFTLKRDLSKSSPCPAIR